ncbi:MAG: hypothetical protein IH866_05425, partial [Chloroflexi bacterium]|nr:hypothetical protein [Chloroflexota bacterium]
PTPTAAPTPVQTPTPTNAPTATSTAASATLETPTSLPTSTAVPESILPVVATQPTVSAFAPASPTAIVVEEAASPPFSLRSNERESVIITLDTFLSPGRGSGGNGTAAGGAAGDNGAAGGAAQPPAADDSEIVDAAAAAQAVSELADASKRRLWEPWAALGLVTAVMLGFLLLYRKRQWEDRDDLGEIPVNAYDEPDR